MNPFTLADGRKIFYQWDSGRQLIVNKENINEVHFSNGSSDSSIVCEVFEQDGKRLVNVPDILLQDTRSISAFAFIKNGGGYTCHSEVYGVRARPKPDDYVYSEVEIQSWKKLAERIDKLEKTPGLAGSAATIGTVELLANRWVGSGNLHSQVVTIDGVTKNSQVDLTPSVEQLVIFYEKDLTFVTEQEGGVVTVYAIGQRPTNDYTIQVTITEVSV